MITKNISNIIYFFLKKANLKNSIVIIDINQNDK